MQSPASGRCPDARDRLGAVGANPIELAIYSTTDTWRQTLPTSLARPLSVPIDRAVHLVRAREKNEKDVGSTGMRARPNAARAARVGVYRRRRPECTVPYEAVRQDLGRGSRGHARRIRPTTRSQSRLRQNSAGTLSAAFWRMDSPALGARRAGPGLVGAWKRGPDPERRNGLR